MNTNEEYIVEVLCSEGISPSAVAGILRIVRFDRDFYGSFRPEFLDWLQVFYPGAKKHGKDSWKAHDCPKMDRRSNHDSMFHHVAESFVGGPNAVDSGPGGMGTHPLLNAQWRAAVQYYKDVNNIRHPLDPPAKISPLAHQKPAPKDLGEKCKTMEQHQEDLKSKPVKYCKHEDHDDDTQAR